MSWTSVEGSRTHQNYQLGFFRTVKYPAGSHCLFEVLVCLFTLTPTTPHKYSKLDIESTDLWDKTRSQCTLGRFKNMHVLTRIWWVAVKIFNMNLRRMYVRCFYIVRNGNGAPEEAVFCHRLVLVHRPEAFKCDYFVVGGITGRILNHVKLCKQKQLYLVNHHHPSEQRKLQKRTNQKGL